MNTYLSTNRKFYRILANILSIFAIVAIAFPVTQVAYAVSSSPFVGHWQATDIDGSDIRLTIGGPPDGPFQITWTESYISFCGGEAGIVRGTGQLDASDPNSLEADLHLECFTTGASLDFHLVWRYHPLTNRLSSRYDNGAVIIWHRPGKPVPPPPALGLRVNYGHDWVEGFYETGHMTWLTLTESDGVTVKATAELMTEPKDYWGGEPGFQSLDSVWLDAEGNLMASSPEIQPYDWVFGWVDNGASAQVQIGEIRGTIDLAANSIEGTIVAPWIADAVQVECLDWGSGGEPFDSQYGGAILADGMASYFCSWEEWDIQLGQNVGVGYFGPDGHWVANAFFVTNPTFVAYIPSAIEGYDWPMGATVKIDINNGEYTNQASSEQRPDFPEGSTRVLFDLGGNGFSMKAGDHIVMTDGVVTKEVVVTNLAVTDINLGTGTVSGTYDPAYDLWVWLYGQDGQAPAADPAGSTWVATFSELLPGAWGGATQWDADGDGTSIDFQVPNPNLYALADENKILAQEWIAGFPLELKIYNAVGEEIYSASQMVEPPSVVPWTLVVFDLGAVDFDLLPGQRIVLTQRDYVRELIVSALTVTGFDLANRQVIGTGDPGAQIFVRVNGEDVWGTVADDGNWIISHPQLVAGDWGEAIQPDGDDGDETRDGFQSPNPNLYALTDDDKIFAQEWTVGKALDLKISNSDGAEIYSDSQTVAPPAEVPWTLVMFDLRVAGFDLLPGQKIILNQDGYVRELLVSSLMITGFDYANQQVRGTGDAGAQLFIRINGEDVWGEVDGMGSWTIAHPQLMPGVWGEAIQPDGEDGDETRDGFQAPFE